jgi:hypothetical protein
MATDSTTSTTPTDGETPTDGTPSATETVDQDKATTVTIDDTTQLPETHPLVKTLAKQKQDLASSKTELAEARAQAAKVAQLEEELGKRPTSEAVETLQTRYDRLESFLQSVGGPISKALDSRTFTRDLFESDKDVKDLVKDFNKANPSATSTALGSSGARPSGATVEVNDLLRAAARK